MRKALAAQGIPTVFNLLGPLLNPAGARQAVLRADSAGVVLMLFGPRGKPVSALQLGDSALTLLDAAGQPVATLGGPGVKHLVE